MNPGGPRSIALSTTVSNLAYSRVTRKGLLKHRLLDPTPKFGCSRSGTESRVCMLIRSQGC